MDTPHGVLSAPYGIVTQGHGDYGAEMAILLVSYVAKCAIWQGLLMSSPIQSLILVKHAKIMS